MPFYLASGVFTMPEFLERRYSPAARWYLAGVSIIGYVLTKISVTIFAGGIVFEALMGLDFWTGAVIVVVATGVYTVFGGLRAVLYTDVLQAFVLIGGSAVVMFVGLDAVGGWSGLLRGPGALLRDVEAVTEPGFPGPVSSSARRYSASGTGAPTSSSSSACSRRRTTPTRGAGRSSPGFSRCSRSSSS